MRSASSDFQHSRESSEDRVNMCKNTTCLRLSPWKIFRGGTEGNNCVELESAHWTSYWALVGLLDMGAVSRLLGVRFHRSAPNVGTRLQNL